jgi:hypothetical protein
LVEDNSNGNYNNYSRYQHAITKAKTRIQHLETGGGILADEMGMGKSLSILALITKSLENGSDWAHHEKSNFSADNTPERRSRATLIIVPSAGKFKFTIHEVCLV